MLTACAPPDPFDAAREQVNGAGAALREAGSATIHFDVSVSADPGTAWVEWEGTTRARYHNSEDLKTPRGKPWVKLAEGASLLYGSELANPDLGLADSHVWLRVLEKVEAGAAILAQTGREENIDGVPTRMYNLTCDLGEECPNADLPAGFHRLFPGASQMRIAFWLDDEGRPRKLELDGFLGASVSGEQRGYNIRGVMTITGLGQKVKVTEPPADQVTTGLPVLKD